MAPTRGHVRGNTKKTGSVAEAEEHEAEPERQNSWTEGSCTLMFDESNSAELRLDLSELRANGGQSRGGRRQHSAVFLRQRAFHSAPSRERW